jgi:hypothetical protein
MTRDVGVQRARGDEADEIAAHHLAKVDLAAACPPDDPR